MKRLLTLALVLLLCALLPVHADEVEESGQQEALPQLAQSAAVSAAAPLYLETVSAIDDVLFCGAPVEPAFIVTSGGRTLQAGTDYQYEFSDNYEIGTARLTVRGIGDYGGTLSTTFRILPIPLSFVSIEAVPAQAYTGNAVAPELRLSVGGQSLRQGTDYSVEFANNIEPGTAVVRLTGKGYFTGETSVQFQILPPVPEKLEPSVTAVTLGVDETCDLTGAFPAGTPLFTATYKTSSSSIASVSGAGVVKAKKKGSATITVSTANGLSAKIRITVKKAPASVKFASCRTVMGAGETQRLACTLSSGSAGGVTYSSSDPSVASVDENGFLTAHRSGTTKITVRTYNGKTKTGTLTVLEAPARVGFAEETFFIGAGDKLTPGVVIPEGSMTTFAYSSSEPDIASIDPATGLIAAHAEGECAITVRTHNGRSATARVQVLPAPDAIVLTVERTTLGVKEKIRISAATANGTPTKFAFKSSRTSYATVSADGLVTAKKTGYTDITVTAYNGVSAKIRINVKKAPTSVKFTSCKTVMGVGETQHLSSSLSSGSAGGVTYSSSDPSVASVDENGLLTAVAYGTTKITVRTYNGKSKTGTLTVLEAPASVGFAAETFSIGAGDKLTPGVVIPEGSMTTFAYSSSEPDIASIDPATGLITAHAEGECVIIVRTHNGRSATARVQVLPAPDAIVLTVERTTLGVKEKIRISAATANGTPTKFTFKSSRTSYATVSADGLVTAKKTGYTDITVTAYNGVSAKIRINVKKAPASVKFASCKTVMGVGETQHLSSSLSSGSAGGVTYSSSDPSVASVDENGLLTAVACGTTKITVRTYNGKSKTGTLTVLEAPESVYVANAEDGAFRVLSGESRAVSVGLSENSAATLRFRVENGTIATVDPVTGVVTGRLAGETELIVTAHNGVSCRCPVQVVSLGTVYPDQMVAHRGRSLSSGENTLEAFRAAVEAGATHIELDVRRCADGTLVVNHDSSVDRTSNGTGEVADMTLEQLRALDFGGSFATLDEVLSLFDGTGIEIVLDMKISGAGADTAALIAAHGLSENAVYNVTSEAMIKEVKAADPDARICLAFYKVPSNLSTLAKDIYAIMPRYNLCTAANLKAWRKKGLVVYAYGTNDVATIRKLVADGADLVLIDIY